MNNLPAWIPNMNAWMSAVILVILAKLLTYAFHILYLVLHLILPLPTQTILIILSIALLSPIPTIAFVHHWLHFFLDRFFPNAQSPEIDRVKGFFPGLISWWEGFFGWQALTIAMLISSSLIVFLLPVSSSLYTSWDWWWQVLKPFFTIATLIQFIVIASLYQFEYVVRNYLISIGSRDRAER
jgi:hypothetical protein